MARQDSILKCKVFWAIGSFGLLLATATAIAINFQLSKSPLYSTCEAFFLPHCLDNLVSNMRVPIGIFTVTLTILGFWALIFRSNQTAHQIELTAHQISLSIDHNSFTNFLAHKNAFMEFIGGLEEECKVRFNNRDSLYRKLFPSNSPSKVVFKGDKGEMAFIIQKYNCLINEYHKIQDITESNFGDGMRQLMKHAPEIYTRLEWLNCDLIDNKAVNFKTPLDIADMDIMILEELKDKAPQDIYAAYVTYRTLIIAFREFVHIPKVHKVKQVHKCEFVETAYKNLLAT